VAGDVPYHIIEEGKGRDGKSRMFRVVWLDPETGKPTEDSDATWESAEKLESDLQEQYVVLVSEFEANAQEWKKHRRKRIKGQ
jgi:hypothetical protein